MIKTGVLRAVRQYVLAERLARELDERTYHLYPLADELSFLSFEVLENLVDSLAVSPPPESEPEPNHNKVKNTIATNTIAAPWVIYAMKRYRNAWQALVRATEQKRSGESDWVYLEAVREEEGTRRAMFEKLDEWERENA